MFGLFSQIQGGLSREDRGVGVHLSHECATCKESWVGKLSRTLKDRDKVEECLVCICLGLGGYSAPKKTDNKKLLGYRLELAIAILHGIAGHALAPCWPCQEYRGHLGVEPLFLLRLSVSYGPGN